jgi:hypothetical protein
MLIIRTGISGSRPIKSTSGRSQASLLIRIQISQVHMNENKSEAIRHGPAIGYREIEFSIVNGMPSQL